MVACRIGFPLAALADLKLPPRPRGDPPMRIVRVMSSDPACEPNCPEWISAEGMILPGTAGAFRKAILDLGGRRLPVLISSHGGSLGAALQMGELIRERRLAVAVARTQIANCPERTPACPGARGQAITGGAFCASACPLILAAGVERLVGPVPMVGVHQSCGTALINSAEIMAGDRGYRYLFVETLPASEVSTVYDGTRKFYAGLGFDSLTRLVDYWGKGKDCLLMLKSIEAYPVSDKRRLVGVVGASRSPQTGAKRRKHPSR